METGALGCIHPGAETPRGGHRRQGADAGRRPVGRRAAGISTINTLELFWEALTKVQMGAPYSERRMSARQRLTRGLTPGGRLALRFRAHEFQCRSPGGSGSPLA